MENIVYFLVMERVGNYFQLIIVYFIKDKVIIIIEIRDFLRSYFGEIYVVFLLVLKVEM